ncbi:MAG: hypothetical protein K2K69_02060 [Muribaculaceae bacterium]|nr:hypothetical protein [Muribaculaceae bacterium]
MDTPSAKDIKQKIENAEQNLSGVAVNIADGEKDTEKLQKERTCTLGNNPRNNEIDN